MRRTVWALLLCLLAVSAGLVWYPYLSAERVSTPFEAAELLQQAGEEPVRFRSSEVDPDTVYRALEARWPYAAALFRGFLKILWRIRAFWEFLQALAWARRRQLFFP